jgi:hypothetical protein
VAYTPDFEPLADALKRVMATGVLEEEAKADLCRAVADRKIRVRLKLDSSATHMGGRVLSDKNIGVPPHLTPDDFDWVRSRPRSRWPVGPAGPQTYIHLSWSWQDQPIELIELSTGDVHDIFGSPKPLTRRAAISRDEKMAERTLRDLLVQNKEITSDEAFRLCVEKQPHLSERGFKERVWPNGRKLANLPPKAWAGANEKNCRVRRIRRNSQCALRFFLASPCNSLDFRNGNRCVFIDAPDFCGGFSAGRVRLGLGWGAASTPASASPPAFARLLRWQPCKEHTDE